jgi:hypothetical protein
MIKAINAKKGIVMKPNQLILSIQGTLPGGSDITIKLSFALVVNKNTS